MNKTFKISTEYRIAYDSPDHIMPHGTSFDNSTSDAFIDESLKYFKSSNLENINFLDLGCAGGQLVVDFYKRGNLSIGLEGSDYSIINKRANWPEWNEKILFTCDIARPYTILYDDTSILFNLITAWEVVEHINTNQLKTFFENINNHLEVDGLFLASVSVAEDVINGYRLHQSVFPKDVWYEKLKNELLIDTNLIIEEYPFTTYVRGGSNVQDSFHLCLKKK